MVAARRMDLARWTGMEEVTGTIGMRGTGTTDIATKATASSLALEAALSIRWLSVN